jgi:ATP-binding cassette subfamily C protein CydD
LDLRTGLAVLLLAPEVYLPLRQVGVHFHASVDGLAAAQLAFAVLDAPIPAAGTRPAPDLRTSSVRFDGIRIVHAGSGRATPDRLDTEVRPGEILALTGPSGAGKSSVIAALLGLRRPDGGRIVIADVDPLASGGDVDLVDVDPTSWRAQLSWVPQHPVLVPGTLLENVRLTVPDAGLVAVERAAALTGLDGVVAAAPGGWSALVGSGGTGLSAGQRQRLALTRVLLAGTPLVILDEPTAHLDAGAEQAVLVVLAALRDAGRSVVLVAHRPALIAVADRVAVVTDAELPSEALPVSLVAPAFPAGPATLVGAGA